MAASHNPIAHRAGLLLPLLLLSLPAYTQQQKIILPLSATPKRNAISVKARINGQPVVLIVDTGATVSLCDQKICGKAPKVTASLALGAWHNDTEEVWTRDFSELSQMVGTKIDGLLGLRTLNEFRRVTLDFEHATLELEKKP